MKYSKATLKFDLNIRKAISRISEDIKPLDRIDYTVDWSNFPNSLKMKCALMQTHSNSPYDNTEIEAFTLKSIQLNFLKQGIKFRDIRKNIEFLYTVTPQITGDINQY